MIDKPWQEFDLRKALLETGLFKDPPRNKMGYYGPNFFRLVLKSRPKYGVVFSNLNVDGPWLLAWEVWKNQWAIKISFADVFEKVPLEIQEKMVWHLDILT